MTTRRSFLSLAALAVPLPAAPPALKITGIGQVRLQFPGRTPRMRNSIIESGGGAPGMNILEVYTDQGITGRSSAERMPLIQSDLLPRIVGENPFFVERIWDRMYRHNRKPVAKGEYIRAMGAVDIAIWDIIGKALGMPVYKVLGGSTKERVPAYCTGNDIEQHVEFGYKMLKLAIPHGPASGRAGMKENVELVKRARQALGPDGEIMLDCWMAWTERYTIEMAEMMAPYRVYWMEEVLQPHDYAGFGRLNTTIKSTRIATGEHEYGRYGFRYLLEANGASIWQPDIQWCGGLTELRRISAMASAYDIPVIPHGGGLNGSIHFTMANVNAPWAELFLPAPGGPKEVYQLFEENYNISRGPDGIYMKPHDRPGWGWDIEVAG